MTTPPPNPSASGNADELASQAARLRTLALVLCASPVVLVVLCVAAMPSGSSGADAWTYPDVWIPAVIGILAVTALVVAETGGYSTQPIMPGTPAEQARGVALARFRGQLFVRFAVTEAVILVGVVLTFVSGGLWPMVIAAVLSWPVMIVEVYPWRRPTEKFAAKLEESGTPSGLAELFQPSSR